MLEQYPIEGTIKIYLLIMEWVIILLFFELGAGFIIRLRQHNKEVRNPQEIALLWVAFGYSIMWVFRIIGDFYITDEQWRNFLYNLSFLWIMLGAFLFIYTMENTIDKGLREQILTLIFLLLIIPYGLLLIFFPRGVIYYMIAFVPFFFHYVLVYIRKLKSDYIKGKGLGRYRWGLGLFISGCIFLFAGYGFTTDIFLDFVEFDFTYRLIGDALQIIAAISIIYYLTLVPSLAEYDWHDKLEGIVLMYRNGLFIFKRFYRELPKDFEDTIYSGYLTSIKILLDKEMNTKGTSTIQIKEKTIIYKPGKYIIGVLICDEELRSLHILLNRLVTKVESIYSNVLENWNGVLKVFAPIESIVDDLFS